MATDNVKVTVYLTPEAAQILWDYGGERGRGHFLSQLLVAQREADDREGQRVADEARRLRAKRARDKYVTPADRVGKRR